MKGLQRPLASTSSEPAPQARQPPLTLDQGQREGHAYFTPQSTAGKGRKPNQRSCVPVTVAKAILPGPVPGTQICFLPPPSAPGLQPQIIAVDTKHLLAPAVLQPCPAFPQPVAVQQPVAQPFHQPVQQPLPSVSQPAPASFKKMARTTAFRHKRQGNPRPHKEEIMCRKCKQNRRGDEVHHKILKGYRWCEYTDKPYEEWEILQKEFVS